MAVYNSGEILTIRGTLDVSGGTFTVKDGQVSRAKLTQEDLVEFGIPLANLRVWDNVALGLSGTAGGDDLAITGGSYGTDGLTLITEDAKASTKTQRARFFVPLDESYVLGETMQMRVRAGMVTTVSDTSATVDLEIYVNDGDGAVGSDLCATAAQSINSLTKANKDFTVNAGSIIRGDVLDCRVTMAITDSATATAVIGEISAIKLMQDIKG